MEDAAIADVVFAAIISIMFFVGLSLRSTLRSVGEMLPPDMERRFTKMLDLQTELLTRTTLICESVLEIPSHVNAESVCDAAPAGVDIEVTSDPYGNAQDGNEARKFTVAGREHRLRSNLFRH